MVRIAILMFCVFSITTGEFVIAGILPDVATGLGVTVGSAGLLVTAYAIGMIVGGPVLTALTARANRRHLMLAMLGVAVLGNTASAFATGFEFLLAVRVATALVTSTFFAQAIVVVIRSTAPDRAGSAVARLALGMNLAMVVGAPLGTLLGREWGWRAPFVAIAACCLAGMLLVAAWIRPPSEEERPSATAELRVLLKSEVLLALAVTAVGNVGVLMVFTYLSPLLADVAGHPDHRLPVLLLLYGVGATIGGLVGGSLYDRSPHRAQQAMLSVLAAVLLAAWSVADTPGPATVAVIVIGGLGFAIIPGMQARVMAAADQAPTLAMAVNASGYQAAAAAAGLFGGLVVDSTAGARPLYVIAAALTMCGLMLSSVRLRRGRVAPEPVETNA
jgi:DHA1 family inner membrane transport protein